MIRQILAMTWKDLKIFFKDRGGMILIFLQPFMFIVVMSYALSGLFTPGEEEIQILAVNQDRGGRAAIILEQMDGLSAFRVETTWEGQPLSRQKAEDLIVEGERDLALVFPPDFSEALEQDSATAGHSAIQIQVIVDPATSDRLVQPVLGTLQSFIASGPVVSFERVTPAEMPVTEYPDTFQQNVPGYTIYGIFWIVSLLAGSVLQEKQNGTFRRLLAAPLSRTAMLAGKMLPYYLINLLQLTIMLGASSLLFGMSLGNSPLGLIAVSLAAAASATGLGVLVAALARTEAQVGGMTVMLLLTLSALGGCFVPRFAMPEWLQTLGLVTPHAWALDAYQDLLVRGYGLAEVLPRVGVLLAFAALFFGIGVWRFRFR